MSQHGLIDGFFAFCVHFAAVAVGKILFISNNPRWLAAYTASLRRRF